MKYADYCASKPSAAQDKALAGKVKEDSHLMQKVVDKARKGTTQSWILQLITSQDKEMLQLEAELNGRVHTLNSLMLSSLVSESAVAQQHIMKQLEDSDAADLWIEHIGTEKSCELRQLRDVLQKWYAEKLSYGVIPSLDFLLMITCVEEGKSKTSAADFNPLTLRVSIGEFANCLKRYGPLRDFLHKATALVYANEDSPMRLPYFVGTMDRASCEARLSQAAQGWLSSGAPRTAGDVCILRYSSQPDSQFVVSLFVMGTGGRPHSFQHITIANSNLGYRVSGGDSHLPHLLALLQQNILPSFYPNLVVNMTHTEVWAKSFLRTSPELYQKQSELAHQKPSMFSPAAGAGAGAGAQAWKPSPLPPQSFAASSPPPAAASPPAAVAPAMSSMSSHPNQYQSSVHLMSGSPSQNLLEALRALQRQDTTVSANPAWKELTAAAVKLFPLLASDFPAPTPTPAPAPSTPAASSSASSTGLALGAPGASSALLIRNSLLPNAEAPLRVHVRLQNTLVVSVAAAAAEGEQAEGGGGEGQEGGAGPLVDVVCMDLAKTTVRAQTVTRRCSVCSVVCSCLFFVCVCVSLFQIAVDSSFSTAASPTAGRNLDVEYAGNRLRLQLPTQQAHDQLSQFMQKAGSKVRQQ